jgi:hypothetical protein
MYELLNKLAHKVLNCADDVALLYWVPNNINLIELTTVPQDASIVGIWHTTILRNKYPRQNNDLLHDMLELMGNDYKIAFILSNDCRAYALVMPAFLYYATTDLLVQQYTRLVNTFAPETKT